MTTATAEAPAVAPKVLYSDQGFWTIAWRQFRKDRVSVIGLVTVALLVALATFSPFIANGRPYQITGVLTNFYANEVAAFGDWHGKYREVAEDLSNAKSLSPIEKAEREANADRYRAGLPSILRRMGSYMKGEDARHLEELTVRYEKLLAAAPPALDRAAYEALGDEIEERFGAFAFEPAYKRVSLPLARFAFPANDGSPALLKRSLDAQEEARYAKEDGDKKALAAAEKKLAALAPEADKIARTVESSGKHMAAFLEPADSKALEETIAELGKTMRALAVPLSDAELGSRFNDLSSKVDALARKPVPPERQRIPRTTLHPVFDYLTGREVGFVVLYATVILVILLRGPFARVTARLPFDPSDLGLIRLGFIVAPALLAAFAWWATVPEREPPADTFYKKFAEDLDAHPDAQSSISFAPVPYGENENLQYDKISAPTWLEDVGHKVKRLREPDRPLPQGVTEEQLKAWMEGDAASRAKHDQNVVIAPWADELVKKRLTRYRYHWLGTDNNGRDVCTRLIMGSRISLSVGFVSVGLNVLIGVFLGCLAGYFRGWVDILISRFTEVLICIPSLVLILTVIVILPPWIPAIWGIMVTLGLINWTGEMRLIRGEYLRLINLDFVTAGRALGLSNARVIFRHMLPNAMAPALVAATFGIAGAILTESGLSFLGLGIQPPAASWGSVLNEAFGHEKDMWWVTIFPGFMIFVTITAYNLVGEGFRDATDPRLRK
ncbi:MAG: ABC transporter permease [Planctomycetota bacterium]